MSKADFDQLSAEMRELKARAKKCGISLMATLQDSRRCSSVRSVWANHRNVIGEAVREQLDGLATSETPAMEG